MWMVPQMPYTDGVGLWLCTFGESKPPARVEVSVDSTSGREVREVELDWSIAVKDGTPAVWVARSRLGGLRANCGYRLLLRATPGSRPAAPVYVRTLPLRVPSPQEPPFVVFLGSCFDHRGEGAAGLDGLQRILRGQRFPHLKLLCGDQVYLDLPVFMKIPREPAETYRYVLGKYMRNWAPSGGPLANGYGDLLRHGANILVSDDHEFWNNYPFPASHVPFTYTRARRELLGGLGRAFVRAFQADRQVDARRRTLREIFLGVAGEPGGLEILALDGRLERSQERAHWPADLDALCRRIRGLRSPAMVVLSQPLFEPAQSSFRRRWVDAGIVDFVDYEPLARALACAPHDVLILSGDIHCGRIAECRTRGGSRIIEVVASPLSLIPGTEHSDLVAHASFPSRPLRTGAQLPASAVKTIFGPLQRDHAVTIEVHAKGRGIDISVSYWGNDDPRRIGDPWRFTLL